MSIYNYEAAFGAADITSKAMRNAMQDWHNAYYGLGGGDPCQRLAYTLVSKLTRTVFGEYAASAEHPVVKNWLDKLNLKATQALQLALEFVRSRPCGDAECCWLSYEQENAAAKKLYHSFGFRETGESDGSEVIAAVKL